MIDESERAWQRLERAHGDTYWYVDTGCGQGVRDTSVVQVTNGDEVTEPSREMEEGVKCERGEPFRYGGFHAESIPDLHDTCRELTSREGIEDVVLERDEDGVLHTCSVREASCYDACGDGFHIIERGFGTRE
jgi:hypothetical protein